MPERLFTDDPGIANDEVLLRRLQPAWIVPGNHGRMRIASAAFKHGELSIVSSILPSLRAATARERLHIVNRINKPLPDGRGSVIFLAMLAAESS